MSWVRSRLERRSDVGRGHAGAPGPDSQSCRLCHRSGTSSRRSRKSGGVSTQFSNKGPCQDTKTHHSPCSMLLNRKWNFPDRVVQGLGAYTLERDCTPLRLRNVPAGPEETVRTRVVLGVLWTDNKRSRSIGPQQLNPPGFSDVVVQVR